MTQVLSVVPSGGLCDGELQEPPLMSESKRFVTKINNNTVLDCQREIVVGKLDDFNDVAPQLKEIKTDSNRLPGQGSQDCVVKEQQTTILKVSS